MFKKNIPKKIKNLYHLFWAFLGFVFYRNPSKKILTIGITGTSGKSSTIHFLRSALESTGLRVGSLSTVDFYIAGKKQENDKKMTMLGKMQIQKYLRKMLKNKCDVAIIEVSSEGVVQNRHKFINFDIVVLTNLYPEHIESHGSFENYKNAKKKFFADVSKLKRKKIDNNLVTKTAIVNSNQKYFEEFLDFNFENKITFNSSNLEFNISQKGLNFSYNNNFYNPKLFGGYNVSNLLGVIKILEILNIDKEKINQAINNLSPVPGRIEFISEAEKKFIKVIVDYAFEPVALSELYKVVDILDKKRIIHVFGSTGGGRDKSRREKIGLLAGSKADICILTDEDPYDEDPVDILEEVEKGVKKAGKIINKDYFLILDRKEAIQKALDIAQKDDIVLITGKGSEKTMCVANGKMILHDDREEVRKYFKN
jgi:UDP-N-acetylmuramoyl-L-alanyl-D-glutamate--2,6-diaminopimelate ligase